MTLALLHSKTFDVGDLPVLTFGNCKLKTGVTKWALKLYVRFLPFLTFFFKIQKHDPFWSCCTRFLEGWGEVSVGGNIYILGSDSQPGADNARTACGQWPITESLDDVL